MKILCLLGLVAVPLFAQEPGADEHPPIADPATPQPSVVQPGGETTQAAPAHPAVSLRVVGSNLMNRQGQYLGRIEEVLLNQANQIEFALVQGNMNDTMLTVVPWSMLNYVWDQSKAGGTPGAVQTFLAPLDKAKLDQAPKVSRKGRSEITPEWNQSVYAYWVQWSKERRLGIDFNPTYFAHRKAAEGFTLSHKDKGIRQFWIEHGIACREIGGSIGKALGKTCVTNFWIPDGFKDTPVDRSGPRQRLKASLDKVFSRKIDARHNVDAVECKLFGLGSESYVVGSHEFYLGYAIKNEKLVCLDAGHFHPTEVISDKISAVLMSVGQILLHVSRGVRWDSDHVVTLTDELQAIAQEIVRGGYLARVHLGLDFFDASINRVAAWVIGSRSMIKALLMALLEPIGLLRRLEAEGDYTGRLALLEECKTLPFGAVWDFYCVKAGVPVGEDWVNEVRRYERDVLSRRS